MKKMNNKAFSLIELSIVLIIIGLLIAGVTAGASLIKSAEIRAEIAEIRNHNTSVNAFYTATGYLPGTNKGDTSVISFANSLQAWAEMVDEGVSELNLDDFNSTTAPDIYDAVKDTTLSKFSASNSPKARIKGSFYALGYNNYMKHNVLFLGAGTNDTPSNFENASNTTSVSGPSLTRKDAKSLDDKLDNGVMSTGAFVSFKATNADGTTAGACTYEDADTTKDCAAAYSIGL